MPAFFIPKIDDEQQIYEATVQFTQEQMGQEIDADRRVYSLHYTHDGAEEYCRVGGANPVNGETVLIILKAKDYGLYYVCTANRGVLGGMPILVGEHDVIDVTDFDAD